MCDLATSFPHGRPDLVSWPADDDGRYLVRNRASGESFQLGAQEHFLLERLDGRHTSDEIASAFAERFGQVLSQEELEEFVQLAADHGLLGSLEAAPRARSVRPLGKRIASRSLTLVSTLLDWPARMLTAATARIDLFRLKHLDFVPREDDIFIVTYPRSGTTWMQMILYQLTTDGRVDFPHIAEYCPWFERSVRSARGFELRPSPRIFKSHLPYEKIPKGPCKYIYVAREGKDVALSCYHLYRNYNGYEGTFPQFFDRFVRGKLSFGSWFRHIEGWWAHRDDQGVLFLTYEELSSDLEHCIRRIAAFIGRDLPPERLAMILERSSFAFMKAHEHQFDPALESLFEQGVQLKSFLRRGRVGEGAVCLTEEQRARFDEAFNKRLRELGIPLP
jgi:hypothetical protein